MCGFIFYTSDSKTIKPEKLSQALDMLHWRGPDAKKILHLKLKNTFLGQHSLLIKSNTKKKNIQPMKSKCQRYIIISDCTIYNKKQIHEELGIYPPVKSDPEIILEGYSKIGDKIFEKLDGMFSVVIYDTLKNSWTAARDAFGFKPIYFHNKNNNVIISSEASVVASLADSSPCPLAISEWKLIRRPIPGKSFYKEVNELLPGQVLNSSGESFFHWQWEQKHDEFCQNKFEEILQESITNSQGCNNNAVSLLSGGLDSALIACMSTVDKLYTVGLERNNEFDGAIETANRINRNLVKVQVTDDDLIEAWKHLTSIRNEPISLPNEGLIYLAAKKLNHNEKIILTGEGADELLFGYDKIFRWALDAKKVIANEFLIKYGYHDSIESDRLISYIESLKDDKKPIEFVEDFFFQVHLPGLLRRMDSSCLAASKEARAPFVSKKIIEYSYRQCPRLKINAFESKIPIRITAEKHGLFGALNRKKIGFSAKLESQLSRKDDYELFRKLILGELNWL